jgi:hypothetical protein
LIIDHLQHDSDSDSIGDESYDRELIVRRGWISGKKRGVLTRATLWQRFGQRQKGTEAEGSGVVNSSAGLVPHAEVTWEYLVRLGLGQNLGMLTVEPLAGLEVDEESGLLLAVKVTGVLCCFGGTSVNGLLVIEENERAYTRCSRSEFNNLRSQQSSPGE